MVVDERLSALRTAPDLHGKLVRRLGRGRQVAVIGERRTSDGLVYFRVRVTIRTVGWIQREAVVLPRRGEDERLWRLIKEAEEFDRIVRARIFLETFPRSPFRPAVLLLLADSAEEVAKKISREAARKLPLDKMQASDAPDFSYFLNYSGLDRYNRQGVKFIFDRNQQTFHYDGFALREILRRYPNSPEAAEARKRIQR